MLDAKHNPETPGTPDNPVHSIDGNPTPQDCDGDYWYALINDGQAAKITGLTTRGLESYRRKGGGPQYVRVSSRCIRYRRIDLKVWADSLLRASTSDDGSQVAA